MSSSLPSVPVDTGAEKFRDKSKEHQLPRIRFLVGTQPRLTFKNLPSTVSAQTEPAAPELRLSTAASNKDDSATDTDDDGQLIQKV